METVETIENLIVKLNSLTTLLAAKKANTVTDSGSKRSAVKAVTVKAIDTVDSFYHRAMVEIDGFTVSVWNWSII